MAWREVSQARDRFSDARGGSHGEGALARDREGGVLDAALVLELGPGIGLLVEVDRHCRCVLSRPAVACGHRPGQRAERMLQRRASKTALEIWRAGGDGRSLMGCEQCRGGLSCGAQKHESSPGSVVRRCEEPGQGP
jgi:hypothetical protein